MPITAGELTEQALLTPEQECRLALQMEAGLLAYAQLTGAELTTDATPSELRLLADLGERARHRYIKANLRLVAMVSRPAAARTGLPESDLFQEGCLGLMQAVERFDCRRGHRFSTYALFWIRAFVGSATASRLGSLNLPASRAERLRAVRGVQGELTQALGRPATTLEVAQHLGRSADWVDALLSHEPPQSLDAVDVSGTGSVEEEVLDGHTRAELLPLSAALLRCLPDLERQVLATRYGFTGRHHSYVETATALGLSVTKVRRVETRALERLRGICPQSAAVHL